MPKTKASKSRKKASEKAHEARGYGSKARIRLDFEKLRNEGWTIEERQSTSGSAVHFTYRNPDGKTIKSAREVERQLEANGTLRSFIMDESKGETMETSQRADDSSSSVGSEDSDYEPPEKQAPKEIKANKCVSVPEGLFVATTSSIVNFVEEINNYFKCSSNNGKCRGKLVLAAYSKKGCGGAMMFTFKCHGCWTVTIDYKSSHLAQESRRQLVSLALSLAFFISGHGYAGFRKTLGRGLGLGIVSEKPYLEVVDLALPYIKSMLDEMCDEAKEHMKAIEPDQIGSWSRAVTCCDGCWLIRGHFSQNCTFVIKNYITGALLYYGHLCMRGAETICDEELWQGTAKAAEGHLSQVLWAKAKDEGLNVEVNWQDADSSSAKGFRQSYSNEQESKIMLCGGHVGRAHGKKLEELKTKSSFSSAFIALHKEQFPDIISAKCCCAGKNHTFVATRNKPVCGCIGPGFIQNAKRNHYCALVHAGNSPDKYSETMLALGRYHSKDIHEWEGGSCTFHPLLKCSCKNCEADVDGFYSELKCSGEDYHSAHVLKCEFHALAYEIECTHRAKDAEKVIDPELGKGHSNLPESTFSVLTKFRAKDTNLHMKHYHAATNLGLLQANMTWCHRTKGPEYHWIPQLYSRMGLPVLDGIQEMCQHDNETRYKRLQRYKTVEGKRKRVQRKVNRAEEQKLRKRYVKNCRIQHTYGEDVEDDLIEEEAVLLTESAINDGTATGLVIPDTITPAPNGAVVEVGGKKCKWCGSSTHSRKSHKDCPYNNSRV